MVSWGAGSTDPVAQEEQILYAVIRAGGKQYKVAKGDVIQIEKVKDSGNLEFTPLLVVDDDGVTSSQKSDLSGARVTAKVLDEVKGPKVDIFKYRSKTRYRRHTGHRQRYTSVEIADIKLKKGSSKKSTTAKSKEGTKDGS